MVEIQLVRDQAQATAVEILAWEFIAWLRGRYPEMSAEIDKYLEHQRFAEEIGQVLARYSPPKGECLLAVHRGEPVGILMLKGGADGVCEMNRMFVRGAARGLGAGRALAERLRERAREMGFRSMILSALPRHHEALGLYAKLGFVPDDRRGKVGNSDNSVLLRMEL